MSGADLLIAADGGLVHCVEHGVWPHVVVGDFDSAPSGLVLQAQTHGAATVTHPADKDRTDLELAVAEALRRGATAVTAVAVLGGRIDHELASIAMLASPALAATQLVLDDGVQRAHVVHSALDLSQPLGDTVSVLPVGGDATGVTATGFKWPLEQATLNAHTTLGVSNVVAETSQRISVDAGVLLVVLSGDR